MGANKQQWEQIGKNGSKHAAMGANRQEWGHIGVNGSKHAAMGEIGGNSSR